MSFNLALFDRWWWWRMLEERDSLWYQVLIARYSEEGV